MKSFTTKNGAIVEYNSSKNIVLKAGSVVQAIKVSCDSKIITQRASTTIVDATTGIITTNVDITFTSESGCASFIQGASTNGKRYFSKYLGTTYVAPATSTTTTTATPTAEAVEESEELELNVEEESSTSTPTDSLESRKDTLAKSIITFCKDFAFKPDPRLLNSLGFCNTVADANELIVNSMELIGYDAELLDVASKKMTSAEFRNYFKTLKSFEKEKPFVRINKRLEIKYGDAGTGKTTSAIKENPGAKKIVASASADPDDLFTFFDPTSKKYELTEIAKAMENGETLIIDEANLYNSVVLARLQGVTDNTNSIFDRGIEIKIKDGFKLVFTLNLETNLGKTPLPSPLVSRASKIENYNNLQDLSWVW